jgi:cobalt-zinc-cadmium efflux system protein
MGTTHDRATGTYDRAFAIGICLNVAFVVIEAVYGIKAHSLALVADAGQKAS